MHCIPETETDQTGLPEADASKTVTWGFTTAHFSWVTRAAGNTIFNVCQDKSDTRVVLPLTVVNDIKWPCVCKSLLSHYLPVGKSTHQEAENEKR